MYIPYITTRTVGDLTRNEKDVALPLRRLTNIMRRTYTVTTGYTQQNYRLNNTVTNQTNLIPSVKQINKVTPSVLDYSSTPRAKLSNK